MKLALRRVIQRRALSLAIVATLAIGIGIYSGREGRAFLPAAEQMVVGSGAAAY